MFHLLCVTVLLIAAPAADAGRFKITTKRENDRVEVKAEKDRAILSIQSPFGISHAVIERLEDKWPDAVVLQLRLKGLENFSVDSGKVKLQGATGMRDGKPAWRLWKDGREEKPLDEKSPFWIGMRILGSDGKPAQELPLKDGHFELQLPPALFERNPQSITIQWIDFYRN